MYTISHVMPVPWFSWVSQAFDERKRRTYIFLTQQRRRRRCKQQKMKKIQRTRKKKKKFTRKVGWSRKRIKKKKEKRLWHLRLAACIFVSKTRHDIYFSYSVAVEGRQQQQWTTFSLGLMCMCVHMRLFCVLKIAITLFFCGASSPIAPRDKTQTIQEKIRARSLFLSFSFIKKIFFLFEYMFCTHLLLSVGCTLYVKESRQIRALYSICVRVACFGLVYT